MDRRTQFAATLKSKGERLTSARWAIFSALSRKGPLPIPQLIIEMRKSAIDPATTYRNLHLFRQLNILRDIGTGNRRMVELSDTYEAHHHHFWCRECHAIIDFDSATLEAELHKIAEALAVTIQSHHLELSGLCAQCTAKNIVTKN